MGAEDEQSGERKRRRRWRTALAILGLLLALLVAAGATGHLMGWTLGLEYLKIFWGWPTAVLVLGLTLRQPLRDLIDRIESAEGAGVKIQTKLANAEAGAAVANREAAASKDAPAPVDSGTPGTTTPAEGDQKDPPESGLSMLDAWRRAGEDWTRNWASHEALQHLAAEAFDNPEQAVVESWRYLRDALAGLLMPEVAHSSEPQSSLNPRLQSRLKQLLNTGLLPSGWQGSYFELRDIYNSVGMGRRGPGLQPSEAVRYVDTVRGLITSLPAAEVAKWRATFRNRRGQPFSDSPLAATSGQASDQEQQNSAANRG